MGKKIDEAKGRMKEAVGDLTDDKSLELEGKMDRAGSKMKDKTDRAIDKVKEKAQRYTR